MTSTRISMGLEDIAVDPGDHICALYRGEEGRDALLRPFLHEALREGDKVIGVVDVADPDALLDRLAPDADQWEAADQLELVRADEAYLPDGEFRPQEMLQFLAERVRSALAESRFRFVRLIGEMTWALREVPGAGDLMRYESELNRSLWRHPSQINVCMYDLERFVDGGLLIEMLRTHPKVLLGATVIRNPWYVAPDEWLALHS
jgi:hypothetical protein